MATTLQSGKDPSQSQPPSRAFLDTVQEITTIYRSLPPRPSIQEVEAATTIVETVTSHEQTKLHEISMQQQPPHDVPEDLFSVLQQLKKTMVVFHCHQQTKEALHLLELEKMFQTFGDLIQKASELVSGDTQMHKFSTLAEPFQEIERDVVITDQSLVNKKEEDEKESQKKNDFEAEKGSSVKGFLSAG